MPGWGIAADLTPPELTNSRQIGVMRKWIGAGLIALLVLLTGAYLYAMHQHSAASDALNKVEARSTTLQKEAGRYGGVTKIQADVTQIQGQIATLMASDVDVVKLMDEIANRLPASMHIDSESISISPAGVASAGASGLDTSGLARIGDLRITGTSKSLDDLPAFIDKLKVLPGVVDVLPTSNAVGEHGAAFTLTIGLNSALVSHRFDAATTGSK